MSETSALGEWPFDLWVDGEQQHSFVAIDVSDSGEMSRTFVSNFPGGLSAGTYEFRARWTPADGEVLDCAWDVVFEA